MKSIIKAMTVVAGLGCAAAYVGPAAALEPDPSLTGSVYMMLPNFTTVRRRILLHEPSVIGASTCDCWSCGLLSPLTTLTLMLRISSSQRQTGAKSIVLIAADRSLASGSLNAAKKAGVPLIAYEHEASGGPVTYYTQFGARKVGEAQGKNAAAALSEGGPYKIARLYGNKGDFYTRSTSR